MTAQPEEIDPRSENEHYYDETLQPELNALCERLAERGMGCIAVVEYDPGYTAGTASGIGRNSCNTMKLLELLMNARGNLDRFLVMAGERFDLSGTQVGAFLEMRAAARAMGGASQEGEHGRG